jgi:hypothetical protein
MLVLLMMTAPLSAQKQDFIGVTGTLDHVDYDWRLGGGLTFEHAFSSRWGLRTGLNYRSTTTIFTASDVISGSYFDYWGEVRENYLSLPVMAKYYTKVFDVCLGTTFDFYTGFKDVTHDASLIVTQWDVTPSVQWGLIAKVSKSFPIGSKFFLEPDCHINPIINYSDKLYWGIGLTGKFAL